MLHALVDGLLAGYGIAIPVGAIAVLIVETGIRSGFRPAAAAGAGAATADLVYASLAVAGGTAISRAIDSIATPFKYVSAAVLAAIAVVGLLRAGRRTTAPAGPGAGRIHLWRTYRRFVGMTLVNPLTVVYFTLFIVGSGLAAGLGPASGAVFVLAAFGASLSWQTVLAGIGGLGHHALSPRFRTGASVLGNLVVLALAVVVALR